MRCISAIARSSARSSYRLKLWLNLVERWFSELTTKQLRRATHRSVRQLNTDIRAWIDTWNDDPKPFVSTKPADQILASIAHYCDRINDHHTGPTAPALPADTNRRPSTGAQHFKSRPADAPPNRRTVDRG